MRKYYSIPVCVLGLSLLVLSCTGMWNDSLAGSFADERFTDEPAPTPEDDPIGEDPHYFYFSYDDSASTAAVELVKYKLGLGERPDATLARPWEFLNFEAFEPVESEPLGDFAVSFGLWERDSGEEEVDYKLGVYFAGPTKSRDRNCVLTLVVDESGSMSSLAVQTGDTSYSRMDILKAGLDSLIRESLIQGDIINLVTFSTDAAIKYTGREFSENRDALLESISALFPDGSTNLDAGLEKAYQAATETFDKDKINRVILLTDAWLNTGVTDTAIISEKTRINNLEGIFFAGVGISGDINEAALNELTEAGKGAYFAVLTRRDARQVFTEKFVALLEVYARNVRFRLDFPESMTHAVTASEESSVIESEVTPTNFSFNTSQYFYEGFTAATSVSDNESFQLTVTFRDPASSEERELVVARAVGEILGKDTSLIRDAESIFLLTELIGGRADRETVETILQSYYADYSSPLFDEYSGLIDEFISISIQE